MNSSIVIVVGPAGSGKSTIIEKLSGNVDRYLLQDVSPEKRTFVRQMMVIREIDHYGAWRFGSRSALIRDGLSSVHGRGADAKWRIEWPLVKAAISYRSFCVIGMTESFPPDLLESYASVDVIYLRWTGSALYEADRRRVKAGSRNRMVYDSPSAAEERAMVLYNKLDHAILTAHALNGFRLTRRVVCPGPDYVGSNKLIRRLTTNFIANSKRIVAARNELVSRGKGGEFNDEVLFTVMGHHRMVPSNVIESEHGDGWSVGAAHLVTARSPDKWLIPTCEGQQGE